jgi:hypothetical protein
LRQVASLLRILHDRENVLIVCHTDRPSATTDVLDAKPSLFMKAPYERFFDRNGSFGYGRVM